MLVDAVSARAVADQQTSAGRAEALGPHRPTDERETWRSYYHARNSILLARRHGRPSWHLWHAAYSARHLQKATGKAERKAILHGLWDGIRGRFGENPGLRPDRGGALRGETRIPVLRVWLKAGRDGFFRRMPEQSASRRHPQLLAESGWAEPACAGSPASSTRPRRPSADRLGALASAMASSVEHRGPDDSGVWVDADAGVAFGHRRLAVIDLGTGRSTANGLGRWTVGDGLQRRDLQPSRGPASIGTCRDGLPR